MTKEGRMSEISGDGNEVELARGMADDFARAGEAGWGCA